ncbi:MAG TPA: DUF302 domain-containing protein [Gemmatimonadales bacterium]|nr:DUF302 domain-containing protein [Gemmatimonadales bacterium]
MTAKNARHHRMHRRSALAAIALIATLPALASAQSAGAPIVQVKAKGSVEQVLGQIKKMVASNGMMVMGELHQGKVIGMTGLKVESETIFVGNPTVGKQLFGANPGVGIAVPVRINVFQDASGGTVVSYVPPSVLLKAFNDSKIDKVAGMLDGKLQKMFGMLGGM